KWLFDIDSLTQSMNYVPVAAGTISNEYAGTQGELNADVGNGEPNSAADDQKQVEDGPHNESDEKDKPEDDSSPKEVNVTGQHVNTTSLEVNTGRFKLNTVDPPMNTASSYKLDSPKDMFKLGANHTLETTHVEFFSDKDEPEVDLGNITNSYIDKQIECLKLNALPMKHVKRGRDTKIPQSSGPLVKFGDEAVHKELGDRMKRAATT
ncbi:hypothetical protein Tco_1374463, partial [Tanacetum coccineum]